MSPLGNALRVVAATLALFAAVAALLTARAILDGERHLQGADASLRRQDFAAATGEAAAAARWYVPGAPHVRAAYARLLHVARLAEANGDREAALAAWRAMRASAVETAWLVQPHQRELDMANVAVARLTSDAARPMMAREETPAQAERRMRELLAREEAPRAPWILALVVGLGAVVIGGLVVARRGLSPSGDLRWDRARLPAAVTVAGLVLYAVAAWQA